MAFIQLLAPTTAAGTSTAVTTDGITTITIGMRAIDGGNEVPIGQYLGCPVMQTGTGGTVVGRARDKCGRPVVLTTPVPRTAILPAGTYVVQKGVTAEAVEIWADDGT